MVEYSGVVVQDNLIVDDDIEIENETLLCVRCEDAMHESRSGEDSDDYDEALEQERKIVKLMVENERLRRIVAANVGSSTCP